MRSARDVTSAGAIPKSMPVSMERRNGEKENSQSK